MHVFDVFWVFCVVGLIPFYDFLVRASIDFIGRFDERLQAAEDEGFANTVGVEGEVCYAVLTVRGID